jgi:hypothetical protein
MTRARPALSRFRPPRRSAFLLLPLLLAPAACDRRAASDPAREMLAAALAPEDRLVALHVLDPDTPDRIVAVVIPRGGKPELRIYEWRSPEGRGRGAWSLAHRAPQGDLFRNLAVEDVTGDGRPEVLATSLGGHLEVLEVITRDEDGTYHPVFQNGGREIEKRYAPGGAVEFWITSRTYEEQPGQPPTYVTSIHRWDGREFTEKAKK